jgi:phage FluMu protein Com
MKSLEIVVSEGAAKVVNDGLRCAAKRKNDPDRPCNKLLARLNAAGQIAGSFLCDRCKQIVSVEMT